jgi:hypothetical protein
MPTILGSTALSFFLWHEPPKYDALNQQSDDVLTTSQRHGAYLTIFIGTKLAIVQKKM